MSDKQQAAPETTGAKMSNTDPSLLLVHQPRINKKFIKVLMVSFGGVFLLAVVIAYSPKKPKPVQAGADVDEKGNIIIRRPSDLAVTAEDYVPKMYGAEETETLFVPEEPGSAVITETYETYDLRPRVEVRESPNQNQPFIAEPDGAMRLPGERRSIFYNALPVAITPIDPAQAGRAAAAAAGYQPNINASLLENAYASDYQKQNMNSIKEEYLRAAQSAEDFSGYLATMYLPSIDPYHEIKSGTFIPITLISSIHSDLPGPIEAQVIENVYDTYSGRNVLIPKGTRIHGDYSSSVAFGQNRVLVVWQRMTLPDGVSVNLQGMQGVDLRGMAGLADKVDYHISELLLAVGISTVWDIGKAAATSALSTVGFLEDINQVLTAQGSASVSTNSATQQIVLGYANKLLNQQPTITIREGIRGNIFVSKDMILPAYGVRF
jgi:type IV secretory pathway VirB10-like protein